MNIEERAAQAAAWKATGQCNCAQAVLKAFEDKLPVDADTLMKLGAGYAAGMGCMESSCAGHWNVCSGKAAVDVELSARKPARCWYGGASPRSRGIGCTQKA